MCTCGLVALGVSERTMSSRCEWLLCLHISAASRQDVAGGVNCVCTCGYVALGVSERTMLSRCVCCQDAPSLGSFPSRCSIFRRGESILCVHVGRLH